MNDLIKKYYNYLKQYKRKDIIRYQTGYLDHIEIDLNELLEFDIELYEGFLLNPREHYQIIKPTLDMFKDSMNNEIINFRIVNIPTTENLSLNGLRIDDIGKLVSIKGMIKRKTDVLPKTKYLEYLCSNPECPFSDEKLKIPQTEDRIKKIKTCPKCKSPVEMINEVLIDYQALILEENVEDLENPNLQPKNKMVELEGDLTSSNIDNNLLIGSKVEIIGFIKKKTKETTKGHETLADYVIECINIQSLEEINTKIEISAEDMLKINELSKKDNILERLKTSIAPEIAGRDAQKEATLYYIVGGNDNTTRRKHIHLFIIGDAALAKSKILRRLHKLLPRSMYASGENTSKAGLTGAAVKDELTGGWIIEAGAMAYANNGYFLLDEADKMQKEDQTNMNEALEHQTISINKIVKGKLRADCSAYVVANPHKGKFNHDMEYIKQIKFDPTFLSRFDLIFILDGKDAESEQELVIDSLLGLSESEVELINDELLVKYLFYAKSLNPIIPKDILLKIKDYYLKIQRKSKETNGINITYRQLNGIIRLCEARAKLHLRKEVIDDDLLEIIELMNVSLSKLGISELTTGVSNIKRSKYQLIEFAINSLTDSKIETNFENILFEINKTNDKYNSTDLLKDLDYMKQQSELFEPRRNLYKLIR